LLSSLLVSAAHAEDWPLLRLCYESQDLPPYTSAPAGAAADHPGLVLELIEQAARSAQLQLVLHRQPWKRCPRGPPRCQRWRVRRRVVG
jgi:polar amino acid transport system substrate-binding protein